MVGILSVETSGDACSVALSPREGEVRELYEHAPRRHNQIIFDMLRELVMPGAEGFEAVDCLAYGAGPGSFTGLRIAASAIQGLAYSHSLPVAPVSTLALLAQAALREGRAGPDSKVLAAIDARVGEIYCATYRFDNGLPVEVHAPWMSRPEALELPGDEMLVAVGDGLQFLAAFPTDCAERLVTVDEALGPRASDALPLARQAYRVQRLQDAAEVVPVYVRDEISWKKLSEQGKRS